MKNQILLFNHWLSAYTKCKHKLANLRNADQNIKRRNHLEKNIAKLYKKLNHLLATIQQAALTTATFGALLITAQTSQAQSFALPVTNPFSLTPFESPQRMSLADLDGDGDLDLLSSPDSYNDGSFYYYKNIGTKYTPVFDTLQTNPFGLISTGGYNYPVMVDLDADGDLDIMAGGWGGYIYFENTGNNTNPAFPGGEITPFGLSDDWSGAPSFADLDGDGDLDILAPYFYGDNAYYENTGSVNEPHFATKIFSPFGLSYISAADIENFELTDLDGDGDFDILAGTFGGKLKYFENIGNASNPLFGNAQLNPFLLETPPTPPTTTIPKSIFPAFGDLDGDGHQDILASIYEGDFLFYRNEIINAIPYALTDHAPTFKLYPNPNHGQFNIDSEVPAIVQIIDASGNIIDTRNITNGIETIDLVKAVNGIYMVKINSNGRSSVRQMVIEK